MLYNKFDLSNDAILRPKSKEKLINIITSLINFNTETIYGINSRPQGYDFIISLDFESIEIFNENLMDSFMETLDDIGKLKFIAKDGYATIEVTIKNFYKPCEDLADD